MAKCDLCLWNQGSGGGGGGGGGGGALIIDVTEVTGLNSHPDEGEPYMTGNVSVTLNEFQAAFTTDPKPVFMRIPEFSWNSDTHFSYENSAAIMMLALIGGDISDGIPVYESINPGAVLQTVEIFYDSDSEHVMFYAAFKNLS